MVSASCARRRRLALALALAGGLGAAGLGSAACGGAPSASQASLESQAGTRREVLLARIAEDPGDVAAQLALAEEEERAGRPAAALYALEQAALGHVPLGKDLGDGDRKRLGRLLHARGLERLRRGAASALADLRRAREAGAAVPEAELLEAEVAGALAEARHSEDRRRTAGLAALAALARRPGGQALWRGSSEEATSEQQADLGAWLWQRGARRAATELLERAGLAADRALLLEARAWWSPSWRGDAPLPPADQLVGRRRCAVLPAAAMARFGCAAAAVVTEGAAATDDERDLLASPAWSAPSSAGAERDPAQAAAWVVLAVRAYLGDELEDARRELERRVDLAWVTSALRRDELPLYARPTLLRLAGEPAAAAAALTQAVRQGTRAPASPPSQPPARSAAPGRGRATAQPTQATQSSQSSLPTVPSVPSLSPGQRLVLAYELALAGRTAELSSILVEGEGPAAARLRRTTPEAIALEADEATKATKANEATKADEVAKARDDRADRAERADQAAAATAIAQLGGAAARQPQLVEVARAYRRDVAVAERKAADFAAGSADAAFGWAQLGALYAALEAPAASRLAWERAAAASAEPAFSRGLALALAAARDPDAALLAMVQAAAASGDPSPVLVEVAAELVRAGAPLHGLQAAKSAIDLATPQTWRAALAVAHRAAAALGRRSELRALEALGAEADETPWSASPASSSASPASSNTSPTSSSAIAALLKAAKGDPSSASLALRAAAAAAPAEAIELLWRATRWSPRSAEVRAALLPRLPAGDWRHPLMIRELAELAALPDRATSSIALAALRAAPPRTAR